MSDTDGTAEFLEQFAVKLDRDGFPVHASEVRKEAAALDRVDKLEAEVREWKREAELSKWPKDAAQEFFRLRAENPVLRARVEALTEAAETVLRWANEADVAGRRIAPADLIYELEAVVVPVEKQP